MQVELAKYEPNIKCDTSSKPGPPWLSCVTVFSNMRASKQYRVFGSYDQPDIEEGLPLVLEAGEYERNAVSHLHGNAEHLFCQGTADARSRSPSPATHPRSQAGTRSGPPWPPSRVCARGRKLRAAKPVGSVSVPCSSVLARDFTHISVEIKRCASEYRPGAVRQGCLCGSCCGKAIERDGRRSLGQLAMRSHRRPGFHVMNVRGESHHTASLSNAYNTLPKKNLHTNRAKAFPPSSCLPRKTQPR